MRKLSRLAMAAAFACAIATCAFVYGWAMEGVLKKEASTVQPQRWVIHLYPDADPIWRETALCIGKVPLSQNEALAFHGLANQIGPQTFCASTIVAKLHQKHPDYAGACREILGFARADGRVPAEVRKLIQAEYRQCIGEKS